jgi:serine/threonine protein kinase
VIDFDLAQFVVQKKMSTFRGGTPGYYSPEMLKNVPYSLEKNQVWQLGCVLYKLYFSVMPFVNDKESLNFDIIVKMDKDLAKSRRQFPDRGDSKPVMDFLTKMLSKDEKVRPTLDDVSKFDFNQ